MGWEYSINLDSEESVSSVVKDLKNCELFSSSTTDYIDWKKPKSIDSIPYDARFYTDKKKTIYIAINSFSKNIFSALKSILAKHNHYLTDCDTDEEVTLWSIFFALLFSVFLRLIPEFIHLFQTHFR